MDKVDGSRATTSASWSDDKKPNPPFSKDKSPLCSKIAQESVNRPPNLAFPALVPTPQGRFLQPQHDTLEYLKQELDMSRLNKIHNHLWLAGLPKGARPLHRQILIERKIEITEQADLHMVWSKSRMFIKPLPLFLLTYDAWTDWLCNDKDLYKNACGFLLSYAWLVCHRSDLKIAHFNGLLPPEIDWAQWTAFVQDFLQRMDIHSTANINKRYRFGELRLSRLNWIYRLTLQHRDLRALKRGFFQGPEWYTRFLQDNFGWLIVVFVYITIVLSAMQVGLTNTRLVQSASFQDASYGFVVFAIIMPVAVVCMILAVSAAIIVYNVQATLKYNRKIEYQIASRDPGRP